MPELIATMQEKGVQLEPAGMKYKCVCPFCKPERPSMLVDPSYQNYRCWQCGAKGDVITFLAAIEMLYNA